MRKVDSKIRLDNLIRIFNLKMLLEEQITRVCSKVILEDYIRRSD